MKPSSFWMYDSSLVREPLKGAGQTMGGLQLVKLTPLVGEGGGSKMEMVTLAERRAAVAGKRVGAMGRVVVHGEARVCGMARRQCVTSHNTLDHADSSRAVHMTSRTRHHLPVAPGHLGPVPCAWNLSLRFISLFGPLSYVHFLSHLCLYVTHLFMIQFLLYPFVSPCPYVSASIPDLFV